MNQVFLKRVSWIFVTCIFLMLLLSNIFPVGRSRGCHPQPDRSFVPLWLLPREITGSSSYWAAAHWYSGHLRYEMVRCPVWLCDCCCCCGSASVLLVLFHALRCHVSVLGKALLGIAAATGELQVYSMSDGQVSHSWFSVYRISM